ncbi:hypothetical protein MMC14_009182 [Varicellaria rhodocarpa]|nr:hypothetical protein [Varicellaria rhodocarpa]
MWLINCRTLALEEIMNYRQEEYAILSHTWDKGEEVQYNEFQNGSGSTTGKQGWEKIKKTCQLALEDGCDFAWVDTCCIDKNSSAELTEAINSMFSWYRGSKICYAYLNDYDASNPYAEMSQSRWFSRGWTLQELIAPARVRFYDKLWRSIGIKSSLAQNLSRITGIDEDILFISKDQNLEELLDQVAIARKMSWAANRKTTRIEDIAYCLLGIFGVNMPLLYGEGERAFTRLQEEIVKNSNDLSLLTWVSKDDRSTNIDRCCGVFAEHPRYFKASGDSELRNDLKFTPDFTMTNKGLKIETPLVYSESEDLYILEVNCSGLKLPKVMLGIFLKHQGASTFARAKPHLLAFMDEYKNTYASECKPIFLSKSKSPSIVKSMHRLYHSLSITPEVIAGKETGVIWSRTTAKPEALWDNGRKIFKTAGLQDFVGYAEYTNLPRIFYPKNLCVVFGFGYGFDLWARCGFVDSLEDNELTQLVNRGDWRTVASGATLVMAKSNPSVNIQLKLARHKDETVCSVQVDIK